MKKFLALALAIAMIVSLSSVAMAATNAKLERGSTDGPYTVKVEDGDIYGPVIGLYGPFGFDAEDRALFDEDTTGTKTVGTTTYDIHNGHVEFGKAAYYALIQYQPNTSHPEYDPADDEYEWEETALNTTAFGSFKLVEDSDVVSNLKIKTDWEEGDDLIKSIKVVKRKIDNYLTDLDGVLVKTETDEDDDYCFPNATELGLHQYGYVEEGDYYYFLVIEYEESNSVNDADLIGTLTLSKSKHPKIDDLELNIGMNIDWEYSYRDSSSAIDCLITDDPNFEFLADKSYALKFKSDDEVELTFEDDSTFTVDVSGQSKILFRWNNEYISKVAGKYPYAELNFWNGNGAKFNRVGEFFLNCEDLEGNQFLYQVNADGTLSEVPGAEWDESDEGFYFNTRVLGSYVVSDMELDVVSNVQGAVSAPVAPAPVVTNPATGVEG